MLADRPHATMSNAGPGCICDGLSGKFTGKERDTLADGTPNGLDYFGARYFSAAQGRFTSPDPLMASGKASNPQSWNRYAYVFNNPLRHVDPDGLEVPESCVKDEKCRIQLNSNVIYDQAANDGRGLTDKQKMDALLMEVEAGAFLAMANVEMKVAKGKGEHTEDQWDWTGVTGLQPGSLNVLFSTSMFGVQAPGKSTRYEGSPIIMINMKQAFSGVWFQLGMEPGRGLGLVSPTLVHEIGEQALHVGRESSQAANFLGDFVVDGMANGVRWREADAVRQLREALGGKRYAVPATPEANKPKQ
jgi:RHS repeat-associated protein